MARLSGPLALLAVIIVWGTLAVVGWALLYWPSLPAGFVYTSEAASGNTNDVLDALYISMVTMSTLGFGDITPAAGWLRIATPLEALFGFALLTVAVSWILQIYPVSTCRRVLAIRLSLLRRADVLTGLRDADSDLLPGVLERLSTDIIQARVDLGEYSETYYFRDADPDASLAETLPYAAELARIGATSSRADMRHSANLLTYALDEFAGVLKDRFRHSGPTTSDLLAASATDHGHRSTNGHAEGPAFPGW